MYYLGVDAGGTKTTAILADKNANVIHTVKIGSGNIVSLGPEKTMELIKNIFSGFSSKCRPEDICSSAFAFAGAGRKAEKQILESILKNNRLQNFYIMTDAEIAHYSIFGSGSGILVIAGTGSVCLVRTDNGTLIQLGGRGFLLGDEGSGYYIGREAIKKALDDTEIGKETTPLTKKILEFYKVQEPKEIISKICVADSSQKEIAGLAQVICASTGQYDAQAIEIIDCAAKALTDLAVKAIKYYCPADAEYHNIALGGGILQKNAVVEQSFKRQMQKYDFQIKYCSANTTAAAAAVMYSMTQSGLSINDEIMQKLKNIQV